MLRNKFIQCKNKIDKKQYLFVGIFLLIFAVGFFLRTYHFSEWLDFESDQARDTYLANEVVNNGLQWPLLGPDMSHSEYKGVKFHVGPMYYYFQIISGKIFGVRPETMAYPDLLFAILSISLFYLFLKKFFDKNISLFLTAFYAVSFYVIQYSRFAYNPNPTPFFVILFLLSLVEIADTKSKTKWHWIFWQGIAIGVGIQLHVTLMILFPLIFLLIGGFLLKQDFKLWKKLLAVISLVLLLNVGQIQFELKSHFLNTKVFWYSVTQEDPRTASFFTRTIMNADCHLQANFHILTSLGDQTSCDFSYIQAIDHNLILKSVYNISDYYSCAENFLKQTNPFAIGLIMLFAFLFSVIGYIFLITKVKHEKNQTKKYFLGIIFVYCAVSFVVLNPVIQDSPLRYFIDEFFVPYLFAGFIFQFFQQKFKKNYLWLLILFSVFIVVSNLFTITAIAKNLINANRSASNVCGPDVIVLGEIQPITDFIIQESAPAKTANIVGISKYTFFNPMKFLANENGFLLNYEKNVPLQSFETPTFFIKDKSMKDIFDNHEYRVESSKDFGQVTIYKLKQ